MKLRPVAGILCFLALPISFCLVLNVSPVRAGTLRITLNDGKSVEVPYYWQEDGQYKFEIPQVPGGIAGIPKDQVKSVQEIVESKEFNPEAMVEAAPDTSPAGQQKKALREIVETKVPLKAPAQTITPDEGMHMLRAASSAPKGPDTAKERTYTPAFSVKDDFSQFARVEGSDVVVLTRSILSSRKDLTNKNFALTLYDGEGNVLGQKPCQLRPIDLDKKTMVKLGIRGHLYTITAVIKPDAKIKRYEIAALEP